MNVMLVSVFEKTKEIGILMAVGWNKFKIFQLIIYESVCLSVLGGIAGICCGHSAVHYLAKTPRLQGLVDAGYSGIFTIEIFFTVLAVAVFSALYPALKATCLSPVEVLRYE